MSWSRRDGGGAHASRAAHVMSLFPSAQASATRSGPAARKPEPGVGIDSSSDAKPQKGVNSAAVSSDVPFGWPRATSFVPQHERGREPRAVPGSGAEASVVSSSGGVGYAVGGRGRGDVATGGDDDATRRQRHRRSAKATKRDRKGKEHRTKSHSSKKDRRKHTKDRRSRERKRHRRSRSASSSSASSTSTSTSDASESSRRRRRKRHVASSSGGSRGRDFAKPRRAAVSVEPVPGVFTIQHVGDDRLKDAKTSVDLSHTLGTDGSGAPVYARGKALARASVLGLSAGAVLEEPAEDEWTAAMRRLRAEAEGTEVIERADSGRYYRAHLEAHPLRLALSAKRRKRAAANAPSAPGGSFVPLDAAHVAWNEDSIEDVEVDEADRTSAQSKLQYFRILLTVASVCVVCATQQAASWRQSDASFTGARRRTRRMSQRGSPWRRFRRCRPRTRAPRWLSQSREPAARRLWRASSAQTAC